MSSFKWVRSILSKDVPLRSTTAYGARLNRRPLQSRIPQTVIGLTLGSAGFALAYNFVNGESSPTGSNKQESPILQPDENTQFSSPVSVLTFAQAENKLRSHATEGQLGSTKTGGGVHYHALRLASNNPVEDDLVQAHMPMKNGSTLYYWGVFDGHAGWATSTVLRKCLVPYVHRALQNDTDGNPTITQKIQNGFLRLDKEIEDNAIQAVQNSDKVSSEALSALAPAMAGSCALLAIFDPRESILHVANVGDSRAVLGHFDEDAGTYVAHALSKDQTGFNSDEVERITREHPGEEGMIDPKSGRLFGLAVTRAFGDHRWKWSEDLVQKGFEKFFAFKPRPNTKSPPYMSAEPVVTETKIQKSPRGDFVILASDGLWDHISSEHAVECVSRWLSAARDPKTGKIIKEVRPAEQKKDKFRIRNGYAYWKSEPRHFVVEEDNAATHLVKNAFGGLRRELFRTAMTAYPPLSRQVRDDITVQIIFFANES